MGVVGSVLLLSLSLEEVQAGPVGVTFRPKVGNCCGDPLFFACVTRLLISNVLLLLLLLLLWLSLSLWSIR